MITEMTLAFWKVGLLLGSFVFLALVATITAMVITSFVKSLIDFFKKK